MKEQVTVCGAGGFVGGRLVKRLLDLGYDVVAASSSPVKNWVRADMRAENLPVDLMCPINARAAIGGSAQIFNLAAKVGGIGYIQGPSRSACLEGAMINLNLLRACEKSAMFQKYFFASSACVYGTYFDSKGDYLSCNESDYISPSPGYGEEKAFSERACAEFAMERGMDIRIARYFTVYGSGDLNKDGKDHVPTALAKKWAHYKRILWQTGADELVSIWGDGNQVRSFLHVDDAVEGALRLMGIARSPRCAPSLVNMSNPLAIKIKRICDYLDDISGVSPVRSYDLSAPTGVQYRVSDNTHLKSLLGWEPQTDFKEALRPIFASCWERELGM